MPNLNVQPQKDVEKYYNVVGFAQSCNLELKCFFFRVCVFNDMRSSLRTSNKFRVRDCIIIGLKVMEMK